MTGRGLIWESESNHTGDPLVVLATGLKPKKKYANRKTGDMVHLWVVLRDVDPYDAVKRGIDKATCNGCPMRAVEDGLGRSCYPHLGMLHNLWTAYRDGKYPEVGVGDFREPFRRGVRATAYGDISAVENPRFWGALVGFAPFHTAYTSAWGPPVNDGARFFAMASVSSPRERDRAKSYGWRTFRTRLPEEIVLPGEVQCPAPRVTCQECRRCNGTRSTFARDVSVEVHGWPAAVSAFKRLRGVGK